MHVAQILIGLACSALGGFVAARIAKHDELLNGALSSLLCLALSIYVVATGQDLSPRWVQMLLLPASPVMALLGGYLMQRRRMTSTHTELRTT